MIMTQRWEESLRSRRVLMASGLRGQWKTRKPANSSSDSTFSRVMVVICEEEHVSGGCAVSPAFGAHLLVAEVDPFVTEGEDARSALSVPLVSRLVVGRNRPVHLLEGLGGTLNGDKSALGALGRRDGRDGGHALELRRELETTLDGDLSLVDRVGSLGGSNLVAGRELPVEGVEGSLLHRVSDDAIIEEDEGVGRGEGEGSLVSGVLDGHEFLRVLGADGGKKFS